MATYLNYIYANILITYTILNFVCFNATTFTHYYTKYPFSSHLNEMNIIIFVYTILIQLLFLLQYKYLYNYALTQELACSVDFDYHQFEGFTL